MAKRAFAIGCHPDDIEFMMSGALILLQEAGYEIHYMNVANGSCGTHKFDHRTIVKMRREEAMNACRSIGAVFHESLVNDIEVFYERDTLFKLGAVMREVAPEILLTHSPNEYMEDHSNTCRLAVTAAFCRGMINFPVTPPREAINQDMTVYHALPYGLRDSLRRRVQPEIFVDITTVAEKKEIMLAEHKSQKEWLDVSQGMDSYLISMKDMSKEVGRLSGRFVYAEGWCRHTHQGFCGSAVNPLVQALGNNAFIDQTYNLE